MKQGLADLSRIETFAGPLKACLEKHPFLNVAIRRDPNARYEYVRLASIELRNHFHLIRTEDLNERTSSTEDELLSRAFEHIVNGLTFFETVDKYPSWCVNVLPLADRDEHARALIAFTFPHTNGDGMSAIAFHKTFLDAFNQQLKDATTSDLVVHTTSGPLATIPSLPVSWSYLLGPALGHYLPKSVADLFGLKPSLTGSDENTWTATEAFVNPANSDVQALTCVETCQVESEVFSKVLSACKSHSTKLTPVLNQLLANAFFQQLPRYKDELKNFNLISTTPINLRDAAGIASNEMGLFASAVYTRHEKEHVREQFQIEETCGLSERMWSEAQTVATETLTASQTLHNQPIGLLSYISDLDKWQADKVGKPRDSSWELSNVMTFDGTRNNVNVQKMFFCQPADVAGPPISFNIVSVRGGVLTICAAWQLGALSLDARSDEFSRGRVIVAKTLTSEDQETEMVERDFVKVVLSSLRSNLNIVAAEP